jgi:dTDP-4-dehydrorhamnose 3,5-epimerase
MDKINFLACGAIITPLRRIANSKGDVFHGIKASEDSFKGFGEAYFSTVLSGVTKGWKLHRVMTMNLIVPVGSIEFYLRSENGVNIESIKLGNINYARLTVPPCVWVAFKGIDLGLNLLLNIASNEHDPDEAINTPLELFPINTIN